MTGLDIITVWVPGIAKTKGSMDLKNRDTGHMVESVDNTGWRRQVAAAVRREVVGRSRTMSDLPGLSSMAPEDLPYVPVDSPIVVNALFVLRPPRTHEAMPSATWASAGDVDKLVRLVGDAMNAGSDAHPRDAHLYADDNLILRWNATKVSATAVGYPPGVLINVQRAPVSLINSMAIRTLADAGVKPNEVGYGGF